MDLCIISFSFNCIMQLKQFYNIATKASSRKKCYYFWCSPWLVRFWSPYQYLQTLIIWYQILPDHLTFIWRASRSYHNDPTIWWSIGNRPRILQSLIISTTINYPRTSLATIRTSIEILCSVYIYQQLYREIRSVWPESVYLVWN